MRQAALAIPLLVLATACSVGDDPNDVPPDELARQVSTALTKQVGQKPDDVTCPTALKATKGATVDCELTAGTDKLGVTVTATRVSADGQVGFSVQVDDTTSN